jgi:hypothetical protein
MSVLGCLVVVVLLALGYINRKQLGALLQRAGEASW